MNNNIFCLEYEEVAECDLNLPAGEISEKEHPKLRLVEKASQSEPHLSPFSIQPEEEESALNKFFPLLYQNLKY